MLFYEQVYYSRMLPQSGKTHLVYVSKFTFLDQLNEEPERHGIRTMHQKLADEEVHTLDVVGLVIVAGEGPQDLPQLFLSWLTRLEELIFGKRTIQIPIYLLG